MKVLLVNGSPHVKGSTKRCLEEVAGAVTNWGIDVEYFELGEGPFYGCTACHKCDATHRCQFSDDPANALIDAMAGADGIIIGTPVYYASANGALCAVLDRAFYAAASSFAGKPAAAIAVCRRGGLETSVDRLSKYFTINEMPVPSSQYWNGAHGVGAREVAQDAEGMQIMRTLGHNMARMLLQQQAAAGAVAARPQENRARTNFIHQASE